MYIPKSFSETDLPTLYAFIQQHNFATLISQHDGEMTASHVPLMLDVANGILIGHLARANPQCKDFELSREVLAIFHGPHAYISPSWYEPGNSVPTWNYATVHVYGTSRTIDDEETLHSMLQRLVDHHEQNFAAPWKMDGLSDDYIHKMMQAVVGFQITITRLEGKYKLSQNRSEVDQQRVMTTLNSSDYPPDREVAALMQQRTDDQTLSATHRGVKSQAQATKSIKVD